MATDNVLEIKNLHTYFYTDGGVIKAVDGVDVELRRGATLGIVGESGSGKMCIRDRIDIIARYTVYGLQRNVEIFAEL